MALLRLNNEHPRPQNLGQLMTGGMFRARRAGRHTIMTAMKGMVLAAAAGHAHAQVTQSAQDATPGISLPAITVKDPRNESSVGLVGKRSRTGTKTDTPIAEIPQTINVVTAEQIEMTGATDINQALRYIPGFSSFGSDARTDWYAALRGFTPTSSTACRRRIPRPSPPGASTLI